MKSTLLKQAMALGAALFLVSAAQADTLLTVAVYEGFPGSTELVAGNYVEGAERTRSAARATGIRGSKSMAEAQILSNLCIADIKNEQLKQAQKSCRIAVSVATSISTGIGVSRAAVKKVKATAYNNRGVLRALIANYSDAVKDFTKAARLNPAAVENRQNLSAALAIDNTGSVAQVNVRN